MENDNLIHWWELSPNIHFKLKKEFLTLLKMYRLKIQLSACSVAERLGVNPLAIQTWERGTRGICVGYLSKVLDILNISRFNVYGNIDAIYTGGNRSRCIKPNLPFKEKNEHIQIIAHGIFDGTEKHAGEKSNGGIVYQSTKKEEQEMFRDLIRRCNFGDFNINKTSKGEYQLNSILAQLIFRHYGFSTIHSRKAQFSPKVMNKIQNNKQLRNLILKAAYIDEGSCGYNKIRDNLCVLSSVNQTLIRQTCDILNLNGYSYFINESKTCKSIYLYAKSLKQFHQDVVILLPKQYYKRINAETLLSRQERENNINKQLIFIEKIVKDQRYIRIFQIQKLLNLHEASARRRINRLIRKGVLIKKSRGQYEKR